MKKIIITLFLICIFAGAKYIFSHFRSYKFFEEEGVFSIELPNDFICLEQIKSLPPDLSEKELKSIGININYRKYKKIKNKIDFMYISNPDDTYQQWHFLSYKEILLDDFINLDTPDFLLQVRKTNDSLVENIFKSIPRSLFEFYGKVVNSLYVVPKIHDGEKIKNEPPVFFPIYIELFPAGKAVATKDTTKLDDNKTLIIHHAFSFPKNRNQIFFQFSYRTELDDEKKREEVLKNIMKSLILNEEYVSEINVLDD